MLIHTILIYILSQLSSKYKKKSAPARKAAVLLKSGTGMTEVTPVPMFSTIAVPMAEACRPRAYLRSAPSQPKSPESSPPLLRPSFSVIAALSSSAACARVTPERISSFEKRPLSITLTDCRLATACAHQASAAS